MDASALDKAISNLENSISSLESSIDKLEPILWISTVAVAIGVGLELYSIFKTYLDDKSAWRKGILQVPSKPSKYALLIDVLSVVLVVFGVLGELAVGVISYNKGNELRSKNGRLVELVRQQATEATKQAGDAKASSNQAADAAKSAISSSQAVHKEVSAARTDLSAVQQHIVKMGTPRYKFLSGATNSLTEALRPFKGQRYSLWITPLIDDEVLKTFHAMEFVFARAKWEKVEVNTPYKVLLSSAGDAVPMTAASGVKVWGVTARNSNEPFNNWLSEWQGMYPALNALSCELNAIGVEAEMDGVVPSENWGLLPAQSVIVIIGSGNVVEQPRRCDANGVPLQPTTRSNPGR